MTIGLSLSLPWTGPNGPLPSLSMDFRGDPFPPGITFTRASAAYYTDSAGLLTNFASGDPRYGDRGFLIEEARTNLCLESQTYETTWLNITSTLAENVAVAPDGTTTAGSITATGTSVAAYQGITYTSGSTYTVSAYLKAPTDGWASIEMANGGRAWYDMSGAGAVGTTQNRGTGTYVSSGIEALASGWYRVWLTATSGTTGAANTLFVAAPSDASLTQEVGDSIIIWGAQSELGDFLSSYIVTTTIAVTRAADVANIASIGASGWFNASAGTIYTEYEGAENDGERHIALIQGNGSNRIRTGQAGAVARLQVGTSGVFTNVDAAVAAGAVVKTAFAYAPGDYGMSIDGAIGTTSSPATLPSVDNMNIGSDVASAVQYIDSYIRTIAYYNTRLPDAAIQALTA